ncbi:ovostatin-like [Anomaloglossus baeobatrachus]|uniref:ovostatin-like n=1 Tax=Anomaloglossus baeobatrachus TaxID=238106 RepID=UPI003F4F6382
MWTKPLLLSISLLGLIRGAKSQRMVDGFPEDMTSSEWLPPDPSPSDPSDETRINYAVIVSVRHQSGKTGQVCVFLDCEEPVQLEVAFEYQSTSTSILSEAVTSKFVKCGFFTVPIVEYEQFAYVTFSAIGATVDKRERKTVGIESKRGNCFAQMEKTLYAQGDTVRCRVFCLDSDLIPTKQTFSRVFLVEPSGARVTQILEPSSDHDVTSVEFLLNEDAGSGWYYLLFERESGDPIYSSFSVERYQLPRFNSKVVCPNQLSVLDGSAKIELSAEYVYGKPLPGSVIGNCCRNVVYSYGRKKNCMRGLENICVDFTGELDSGDYIYNLDLDTFKLQLSEYENSIQCKFTVKEDGTDVLDTKSCYIYITNQPANLQLDYQYNNQYYKHDLDYPFAATLTDEKGQPMPYETIIIDVDGKIVKTLTTDAQGRVECAIDTKQYYNANLTIRASYPNEDQCYVTNQYSSWMYDSYDQPIPEYPYAQTMVYRFFSESDSVLQIKPIKGPLSCNKNHSIEVEYRVTEAGVGRDATSVTFYHMVRSKEGFKLHSTQTETLSDDWKGSYSIDLYVNSDYATNAQILIWAPMLSEIISDSLTVAVESCFKNEVSMTFTQAVVAPGSTVEQEISAAPGSFCGVRAWDTSLDLLGMYNPLTPDNIYSTMTSYYYGYYVQGINLEEPAPPCEDPDTEVFCNGRYYRRVSSPTDGDSYGNFLSSSVIVASNLLVRKPQVCGMEDAYDNYFGRPMYSTAKVASFAEDAAPPGSAGSFDSYRSNFGDIFGWGTMVVGSDSKGTIFSTIPDEITEWKSDAFCLSETDGLGLTNEPATVITFLGFFAEVTVAQYCTTGEKSIIVVSAANYLGKCVKVKLEIEDSDDYVATPYGDDDDDDETCICDKERTSKQWVLEFTKIGDISITASASTVPTDPSDPCHDVDDDNAVTRKDTVRRVVKVEAQGIKHDVALSYLHHVDDSVADSYATIQFPDDLVEDSYQLYVTCVGDTIQLGVENLNRLLNLPDGCCEQNLLRILSAVYFYRYLSDTGRLTPEFEDKVKNYLINAYGRQLPCRIWNNQYSIFRNSFTPNSWVLANTFYAFELAKDFIYVDTAMQQQTLVQLGNLQDLTTGCFRPEGSLFTIEDDDENNILFTAYVLQRLLESGDLYGIGDTQLEGGKRCLQNAEIESLNIYTLSYVSYAAALAGLDDISERVFNILENKAITEDGFIHFERENLPPKTPYYYFPPMPATADVDITTNIFLAYIKTYEPTPEKKAFLGQIAAWLTFCQNSGGGYTSSQDTMVVIKAMTEYGRLFFVGETNAVIVVNQGDTEVARITVDESNKLLVQRLKLEAVPGDYHICTTGTGNLLVQLNSYFNTKATNAESSLTLNATTQEDSCTNGVAYVVKVDICVGYHGSRRRTNMILLDINQLTGYPIDRSSVYDLLNREQISEYGFKDNHVYMYLKYIETGTDVCFTVRAYQGNRVLSYRSATVIARDYYYAVDVASASYDHPCSPLLEG